MTITAKNPRQLSNINYLLKQTDAVYESHCDGAVQVVKYTQNDKPIAAIFRNKKQAPVSHYRYASDERRTQVINEQIENALAEKKRKAERKARPNIELNVGDILYTSWGYEQTNIDYYKVVALVGKATAEYVKIGLEHVKETSWCSAEVKPVPSQEIGEIQRGRIGVYGVKIGRETASKCTADSTHHCSWGY